MTKWELGQDLIAINDYIGEKIYDINKAGNKRLAIKLDLIRAQVGDLFNDYSNHDFGIFDSESLVNLIQRGRKDCLKELGE